MGVFTQRSAPPPPRHSADFGNLFVFFTLIVPLSSAMMICLFISKLAKCPPGPSDLPCGRGKPPPILPHTPSPRGAGHRAHAGSAPNLTLAAPITKSCISPCM